MQTNFIIKNKNPRIKSLGDNITSHHTLGAFLSGQDMKMVQQEGNDTNCFVSLVVDTKGTYVAIVTRKVQTKSEVTIKKLGTSYEFFGEGSKEITHDDTETTKIIDKEVIEYFDLEVERHEVPNTLEYLDARFEEIERKKEAEEKKKYLAKSSNSAFNTAGSFWDYRDQLRDKETPRELELFSQNMNKKSLTQEDNRKIEELSVDWKPNPKKIHTAVVHILTCNLILNPEKIDLKQWVTRHMTNVYKKVFGEHSVYECENNASGAFSEWKDYIIQYTLDYFDYNDAPDEMMENDFDFAVGLVAQAILDEISEFIDVNPYIQSYCNTLYLYLR